MEKTTLFMNGGSQAVRIPKEFRFEGTEVFIKKVSEGVLLIPKEEFAAVIWQEWAKNLAAFDELFEIESAVQAELGTVSGDWTPKVTLNQKIVSAVRDEARNAAEDVVRDAIPDARNHAQHLVNSKLNTVDRYIERALVERIGALVDHVLKTHVKLDITTSLLSALELDEETEQT